MLQKPGHAEALVVENLGLVLVVQIPLHLSRLTVSATLCHSFPKQRLGKRTWSPARMG